MVMAKKNCALLHNPPTLSEKFAENFNNVHMMKGLFSKPVPPEEQVKEWRAKLRSEGHQVDREIRSLERSEEQVKKEIKKLARVGESDAARVLARELVVSRRGKERMYETKARLNSVVLQMSEQLAMLRTTRAMAQSAECMRLMNELVRMPVVAASMREMARQMEKAGLIQELMDDTLQDVGQEKNVESEAEEEVQRVLDELTADVVLPNATKTTGVGGKQKQGDQQTAAASKVAQKQHM